MKANVLRSYHQLVGAVDIHDLWVPGTPAPVGVAPYIPFSPLLTGFTNLTAQWGSSVGAHTGNFVMQRGTDIGPLIIHKGVPNLLMPAILLLSGSKSHFGTTKVSVEGKPAAVAVAKIVNINLDCCGPLKCPPMPFGLVPAWCTVEADFTEGDFWAGVAHMAVDMVLEFALNWIFFGIGKIPPLNRAVQGIYERFLFPPMAAALRRLPSGRIANWLRVTHHLEEALAKGLVHQLPLTLASVFVGSPVGGAPPFAPAGSGAGTSGLGDQMDKGHDAVRDHVNNSGTEEHPSSPPDSGSDTSGAGGADAGAPDSGAGGADGGTGGPDAGPGGGDGGTDGPDAGTGGGDAGTGGSDAGTGGSDAGTGGSDSPDAGSDPADADSSPPPDEDGPMCTPDDPYSP